MVTDEKSEAAQRKKVLADAIELVETTLECTRLLDPHLLEMAEYALMLTASRLGALKLLARAKAAALKTS